MIYNACGLDATPSTSPAKSPDAGQRRARSWETFARGPLRLLRRRNLRRHVVERLGHRVTGGLAGGAGCVAVRQPPRHPADPEAPRDGREISTESAMPPAARPLPPHQRRKNVLPYRKTCCRGRGTGAATVRRACIPAHQHLRDVYPLAAVRRETVLGDHRARPAPAESNTSRSTVFTICFADIRGIVTTARRVRIIRRLPKRASSFRS